MLTITITMLYYIFCVLVPASYFIIINFRPYAFAMPNYWQAKQAVFSIDKEGREYY